MSGDRDWYTARATVQPLRRPTMCHLTSEPITRTPRACTLLHRHPSPQGAPRLTKHYRGWRDTCNKGAATRTLRCPQCRTCCCPKCRPCCSAPWLGMAGDADHSPGYSRCRVSPPARACFLRGGGARGRRHVPSVRGVYLQRTVERGEGRSKRTCAAVRCGHVRLIIAASSCTMQ